MGTLEAVMSYIYYMRILLRNTGDFQGKDIFAKMILSLPITPYSSQ